VVGKENRSCNARIPDDVGFPTGSSKLWRKLKLGRKGVEENSVCWTAGNKPVNKDFPDNALYKELVEQVNSRRCVAFIGSGLSMGQYPSWPDLIGQLCEACGLLGEAADARKTQDPDVLTRLADVAHDRDREAYHRKLDDVFGRRVTHTRAAYGLLARLPFASYVTVNFDPLLGYEGMKPEHNIRGIRTLPALQVHELASRCIFYVHGYIQDGRSSANHPLVLRHSEFERAYDVSQSMLHSFLQQLLISYPVLFIGVGLGEPQLRRVFEICRGIRRGIEEEYGAPAPKRYILRPTVLRTGQDSGGKAAGRDEVAKAEAEEDILFEEIDVKVVRYYQRDSGHSGIEEMLEEWGDLSPPSIEPGFFGGGPR
jgi:hypothetical protein